MHTIYGEKIGFIGLGKLGMPCAEATADKGFDVAGAGDSLLAALSVGLCSGTTLMHSSAIGARMASLAVQQIGNIPISYKELKNYLNEI